MSEHAQRLKDKIRSKEAVVGIIGMGYVGYPMAHLAAQRGFHVVGIEVDQQRVNQINNGESYIQDVPTEQVAPLVKQGLLRASTDYAELKNADVVLITVPTPLGKTGDPDMEHVMDALVSMQPHMHEGMLIVLESTTYPGTTEEMFEPAVNDEGFVVGEHVFIAFSPERIDPGNIEYGPRNTPKVVGGISKYCTDVANAFYSEIIEKVVPLSSTTAAEMVKLYENTFRAINIGLVNELAIICNLLNVDVWEIIDAAATKPFGFMPFWPGPGLGGHCIPVDPSYLSWKMRSLEYKTRFIDLATEVNTKMPEYVVSRVGTLLNDHAKPIRGSKILLLGMAYKNDIDDLRESPALDIYSLLHARGADMSYHDPYCPTVRFDGLGTVESSPLTAALLNDIDLVIITTGHKRNVDYDLVMDHAPVIFDTRNTLRSHPKYDPEKVVFL